MWNDIFFSLKQLYMYVLNIELKYYDFITIIAKICKTPHFSVQVIPDKNLYKSRISQYNKDMGLHQYRSN